MTSQDGVCLRSVIKIDFQFGDHRVKFPFRESGEDAFDHDGHVLKAVVYILGLAKFQKKIHHLTSKICEKKWIIRKKNESYT